MFAHPSMSQGAPLKLVEPTFRLHLILYIATYSTLRNFIQLENLHSPHDATTHSHDSAHSGTNACKATHLTYHTQSAIGAPHQRFSLTFCPCNVDPKGSPN
jgi:hypothetical protein